MDSTQVRYIAVRGLPHGIGKWRSPDASTHMEGEWFDGHLYMFIKPQQEHNNDNNTMLKQPLEQKMRRRASENDLSLMAFPRTDYGT